MKKTLVAWLMIAAASTTMAQVSESANWYNGWLVYSAQNIDEGKVLMNATAEGEEHEFVLVPMPDEENAYRVTDGPHDYVNVYSGIATVRHIKEEGMDVLCFYNDQNQLEDVMSSEQEASEQQINIDRYKRQLVGKYSLKGNADKKVSLDISMQQISINSRLASYEVATFNGMVLGFIRIVVAGDSTSMLNGLWELEPTLEGFRLYGLKDDEFFLKSRNGTMMEFVESDPAVGRFDFTSKTLLNDKLFRKFSKSALRIMRNEIQARHGYRFKSQDLQEYFGQQPWYHPAATNDGIKLTFVELLNTDLIKCQEAKIE